MRNDVRRNYLATFFSKHYLKLADPTDVIQHWEMSNECSLKNNC